MAARTSLAFFARLGAVLNIWIWGLALILFALRWDSVERPHPPIRDLFPNGEIRVGVDASFPPFAVATDHDLYGLDIDIAEAIGERLNIPVRFVNLGFDGLYDALKVDQVDMLISALPIDYSRSNEVLFTVPYFNAGLELVSQSENISGMRDLSTHSLAFEFGSEAQQQAETWLRRIQPFKIQAYETANFALEATRREFADAALVDAVTAHLYLRRHPEWKAQQQQVTDNLLAASVKVNHYETYQAINRTMQLMLEDGTINALLRKWL
ncbi:MAG: transporter substrate-binding domain-containing protein [Anaerolineae bacterium]